MPRKFLFGPVTPDLSVHDIGPLRRAGMCLTFGSGGDIATHAGDRWADIVARIPAGWQPDSVVVWLGYTSVPQFVWSTPLPVVGLAPDWNLLWHAYRHIVPRCDAVLTDALGVTRMRRAGWDHVFPANLYGLPESYFTLPLQTSERDIDVLFVGNANPAVQAERLPWIARLADLSPRYRVVVTTGVFGADYRALLNRAKIVFNRSVRGECNQRTFEAAASGAVLFQEAENQEIQAYLTPGIEYVPYTADDLLPLLESWLDRHVDRTAMANRARARAGEYLFGNLLATGLSAIDWETIQNRARHRVGEITLAARVWQRLSLAFTDYDPSLSSSLTQARDHHSLGLLCTQPNAALPHFQAASSGNRVSQLAYAECLAESGRIDEAITEFRSLLTALDHDHKLSPVEVETPPYPARFESFRVGWERAAWIDPSDRFGEMHQKHRLLRWRALIQLAELTNDLACYLAAFDANPTDPPTRAAVGCALARSGDLATAAEHLEAAVAADPFDCSAARALYQVYVDARQDAEAESLAESRRRLHAAADRLVPYESWFYDAPPPAAQLSIVWEGELDAVASLAGVNRAVVEAVLDRGHDVAAVPIPPQPGVDRVSLTANVIAACTNQLRQRADVHVRHCWPPNFVPPAHGAFVLMQPWEFGSLPTDWVDRIRSHVDEVWAYSSAVRDCYLAAGVPPERVRIVPLGVDTTRFRPGIPPLSLNRRRANTTFLFVGGTIHRKGFDLLLTAYARTFRSTDDVVLLIKEMGNNSFYRGQTAGTAIAAFRANPNNPAIEYLTADLSDEAMPSLYAACDCLIHPYRAEGFGLPVLEAMACGKPVIATAFGSTDDFLTNECGYRIPARRVEFPENRVGEWATVGRPWWWEPDVTAISTALRRVANNPDEAREKGEAARRIALGWTWGHTAAAIEQRVRELRGRLPRRAANPKRHHARVSLTMIVRNEEANLPHCLEGLRELFDEIVVADTGSTDRTREIAAQYGARVVDFPWVDDFAAARNAALSAATGDYAFWLDADDRLDRTNRDQLRTLFSKLTDAPTAYVMKCRCVADRPTAAATVVDHVRLFPIRTGVRWMFRVHEQILPSLRSVGAEVRWADVVIEHVGYTDTAVRHRKLERDTRLLQLELADRPDHPFALFNLGSVYHELGNDSAALDCLTRSLAASNPRDSIARKLYALIAQTQTRLGNVNTARDVVAEGRKHYPQDAELLFIDANQCHIAGETERAVVLFRELVTGSDADHFGSADNQLRSAKGRYALANALRTLGRNEEAIAEYRATLAHDPGFEPAYFALSELMMSEK